MSELDQERDTAKRAGKIIVRGAAAEVRIFAGSMVARNASGYAVPAADTAGLVVEGRAAKTVDNSGGENGDLQVEIEQGVFLYDSAGLTEGDAGKECYAADDQTVNLDGGTNHVFAGVIMEVVSADEAWVKMGMAIRGDKGDQGDPGSAGAKGDKGDAGDPGSAGAKGDKGDQGDPGSAGAKGDKGDAGDPGSAGAKGDKGDQGDPGSAGAKGDKGDQGDPGSAGAKGDKGDQGDPGSAGAKGDKGDAGDPGSAGAKGDKGDQGDPGSAGAKGDKGDKGDQGDPGEFTEAAYVGAVASDNAGTQGISYVQMDVQRIATLADENKTQLNAVIAALKTAGLMASV